MEIDLRPVGQIDHDILLLIRCRLNRVFGCKVTLSDQITIPEEAFNQERKQFLSDTFIDVLKTHKRSDVYLLGITNVDLYTAGLNFVFGQADVVSGVSVISLYLLRQETYGLPADRDLLIERAQKEAVHELGHNLGMGHCSDGICVMHFSNSLIDTDIKKPQFCTRCQPKLAL